MPTVPLRVLAEGAHALGVEVSVTTSLAVPVVLTAAAPRILAVFFPPITLEAS